jgi:hypothetical protein
MSATTVNLKTYDSQQSWIDQVREIQVARLGGHERYKYESLVTGKGIFTLFKDIQNCFVVSMAGLSVVSRSRYYLVYREDRVVENHSMAVKGKSYQSIDEVDTFARERLSTHSPS